VKSALDVDYKPTPLPLVVNDNELFNVILYKFKELIILITLV